MQAQYWVKYLSKLKRKQKHQLQATAKIKGNRSEPVCVAKCLSNLLSTIIVCFHPFVEPSKTST